MTALEALQRDGHNLGLVECDTVGTFDTPILLPVQLTERVLWTSFNCAKTTRNRAMFGIHFFIDDYLFERTWNDPARYALLLKDFRAVMTPDFSLFTDYPKAVQIYNHYRKHLLGAYWQRMGMAVIPSVCWSDHDSYAWCFDGEPQGGTVAVSSVGTQKSLQARAFFLDGYREMLARLRPSKIIFFGDVPDGCEGNIEHHDPYYKTVYRRANTS